MIPSMFTVNSDSFGALKNPKGTKLYTLIWFCPANSPFVYIVPKRELLIVATISEPDGGGVNLNGKTILNAASDPKG